VSGAMVEDEGGDVVAIYERLAEAFRRETRIWPPGKDRPSAMGSDGISREERWRRWDQWLSPPAPQLLASPSPLCRDCGSVEVEDKGDRCEGCEPRDCDQCGRPSDGKLCSVACRAAFESDRG
jgi:hypothetical protein